MRYHSDMEKFDELIRRERALLQIRMNVGTLGRALLSIAGGALGAMLIRLAYS